MADKTGIEWTDATWNPISGCTKVSQGCKHCYAERDWARLQHLPAYAGRAFTDVATHPDRLDQPLRWRRPRRIFVNSMSDLFHPDVPDDFIDRVFAVMALAKRHTFQILTKRPDRMLAYLSNGVRAELIDIEAEAIGGLDRHTETMSQRWPLPLPNVWLGVSVEDQQTVNERIPLLIATPAAVRWISAEPLLGPVSLRWLPAFPENAPHTAQHSSGTTNHLDGLRRLDWVVIGGESGPKARPMHPDWVRSIRDQCAAGGVPFMFKQHGEWLATDFCDDDMAMIPHRQIVYVRPDGSFHDGSDGVDFFGGDQEVAWVGKKAAGRQLDGVEHNGFPEAAQL